MTVYLYYPRGSRTGGPEALHQLARELESLGIEARLVPIPGTEGQPEVEDYLRYNCQYEEQARDSPVDTIVVPELAIRLLGNFRNAKRVLWWLSVDNSSLFRHARVRERGDQSSKSLSQRMRARIGILTGRRPSRRRQIELARSAINCTQSSYAWSYIYSRLGIVSSMLTDFTELAEFDHACATTNRRMAVAYNPKKGARYTMALEQRRPDIDWVPIVNMSRSEVISTLQSVAIYLDLGHHPGKDRLPREAALAGAVVIAAKRGAGAFHADTPLSWRYKVNITADVNQTAKDAAWRVDWTLAHLDEAQAEQARYTDWIRSEHARFRNEVSAVFEHETLGFDVPGFE